jgi:pimeloyl-ACP methyl ester carboxylesterase
MMSIGPLLVRVALLLALLALAVRWFERRSLFAPSRTWWTRRNARAWPSRTSGSWRRMLVRCTAGGFPTRRRAAPSCTATAMPPTSGIDIDLARDLHRLRVNVFLFDYRGYGRSKGWPTEQGTYRDARAAYEVVRARYADAEQPPVIVYGASLGGAIAVQLALDKPVRGLILEGAFTSTIDVGRHLYPLLPVRLVVRYRYDALSRIPA